MATQGIINPNSIGFNNGFMNLQACNQPKMITINFDAANSQPEVGEEQVEFLFDMAPIIDQNKIDIIQGMIVLWEGNNAGFGSSESSLTIDFGNGLVYRTIPLLYSQGVEMHRPVMVNNPPNIKITYENTGGVAVPVGVKLTLILLNVMVQPHDYVHDYPVGI